MVKIAESINRVPATRALDVVTTEQAGDVVGKKAVSRAYELEKLVVKARINLTLYCIELGGWLKEIRDDACYKLLGFNSFTAWLENPHVDISHTTAYRYIFINEKFVLSGLFKIEELQGYSISKLEILAPYTGDMAKDKEKKLEYGGLLELSRRELEAELKRMDQSGQMPELPNVSENGSAPDGEIIDGEFEPLDFGGVDDEKSMEKVETAPPGVSGKAKNTAHLKGTFKLVPVDINTDGWKREPTKDILMNVENLFVQTKGGEVIGVAVKLDEKFNIFE